MGKKIFYMILGLIIAIVVIAECFSSTAVKTHAHQIEKNISRKIEKVFGN
jgi:hypothetical protein